MSGRVDRAYGGTSAGGYRVDSCGRDLPLTGAARTGKQSAKIAALAPGHSYIEESGTRATFYHVAARVASRETRCRRLRGVACRQLRGVACSNNVYLRTGCMLSLWRLGGAWARGQRFVRVLSQNSIGSIPQSLSRAHALPLSLY